MTVIGLYSLCFLVFCVTTRMAGGDLILLCTEVRRNVTIIPHILFDYKGIDDDEIHFLDSVLQLRYLTMSMLGLPCFNVWAFSPIHSRLVRINEKNCVQFFEMEFQAFTSTDGNELMKALDTEA